MKDVSVRSETNQFAQLEYCLREYKSRNVLIEYIRINEEMKRQILAEVSPEKSSGSVKMETLFGEKLITTNSPYVLWSITPKRNFK